MMTPWLPAARPVAGRASGASRGRASRRPSRRYVRGQIARVTGAGFRIRRLSHCNPPHFPVIAGVRLVRPDRPGARDLKSDFTITRPGPLNAVLGRVLALEAPVLERANLPFGVSILGIACKPPARAGACRRGREIA